MAGLMPRSAPARTGSLSAIRTWAPVLLVVAGSTTSAVPACIGRLSSVYRGTCQEAQRGGDPDGDQPPPQDLQGPPQVQRLLTHLASIWFPGTSVTNGMAAYRVMAGA